MKKLTLGAAALVCTLFLFHDASAQVKTNTEVLKQTFTRQKAKEKALHERLVLLAKEKGWEMVIKKPGYTAILVDVDGEGLPIYLATENNIISAATIGTNKLWPGGSTGLNLSGSSNSVKNKLAVWDGGKVQNTHVELVGRIVQRDGSPDISDHATHVSGTMIASGVNPSAKGMSYGQQELVAYDFGDHISEIVDEAPNLLISNHSYGVVAGWTFASNRWEFRGRFGDNEDYKFGYYSVDAQMLDSISYNAPFYLIVKSSGNSRDVNGPAVGQPYWRYNATGTMADAGLRPVGISDNDSFDIISTYGTAKNILTVGAINPISSGYSRPTDVTQSTFTSWGPTDDGRIKPDVVADGVNVLSSLGSTTSTNQYAAFSGTSMATPAVSGSLLLLQEYYNQLHPGTFMRSATLKAIAIHTAEEAGTSPGPDYKYGWGLVNMQKAAAVITGDNATQRIHQIRENVLNNGGTLSLPVVASGNGTISATIVWTDPKSPTVEPTATALNNNAKKLVNDLDIVIKKGATVFRPWMMNPAFPNNAATKGDNTLDNVEKVELADIIPGEAYTIEITHKGTLARGSQAYSLIASGIGGSAYCASAPTSNAGARIDSVSIGAVRNKNVAGCTTYGSFTNLTASLEPGQTTPLFVRLNSCDASNADKIVKVYIDANNDGDFTDADETLATSAVINGNGDFITNINVPTSLKKGQYTILRIVMQETSVAANVTSCGSYTRGETQDYRILVSTPAIDFGITELVAPEAGDCSSTEQYVSIRITNFGTADKKNIPLTAVLKQGTTTIATLTATYTDTVYANTSEVYTFQTPVTLLGNTAYSITANTAFTGDQVTGNDQNVTAFTTAANSANPAGTAVICGTNVLLKATPAGGTEIFNWYTSAAATTPIASGANATTTTTATTYYLSKNEMSTKLGPVDKLVFPQGGYNAFVNNIVKITATVPTRIETSRLYIGTSGKITFLLREIVTENPDGSYNYFPISSTTIDVYATKPTPPVLGDPNNDPNDPGAIYYLGIDLPEAANYYLIIQCQNGASIFRNNMIATNPYPFTVPGIASITGNTATPMEQFYYFYYNTALSIDGCPSARVPIVPTTAPTPVITIAGNVLSTTNPGTYQWLRNGTPIPAATLNTYTATEDGDYSLRVTSTGCLLVSNIITFSITAVPNVDPAQIGLVISPVPARGSFDIKLRTTTRADLTISLVNTTGQQVYQTSIPNFIGNLTKTITPGKIAAGVYYLQVHHDKKMYIRKMIIIE